MDELFLRAAREVIAERQRAAEVRPEVVPSGPPEETIEDLHAQDPNTPLAEQLGFQYSEELGTFDTPNRVTPEALTEEREQKALLDSPEGQAMAGAVFSGAAKSVFELNDAVHELQGDPVKSEEWSGVRKAVEDYDAGIGTAYPPAAVVSDISQFATGLLGAGKALSWSKAANALKGAGALGRGAWEMGRGAVAGYFSMDPHEERLSNLIQEYPGLQNPVNEYLAASPEDGYSEGRLKNALEGMGLDLAVAGVFGTALKAVRLFRRGDIETAQSVVEEMAQPRAVEDVLNIEKPRVRVKAGSQVIEPQVKPRVRVKAGSTTEANPGKAADDVSPPVDEVVRSESAGLPASKAVKDVPPAEITPDQMSTILRGTDFDLLAMDQAGSFDEALSQGHRFADGGSLPWQKLQSPEEAVRLIDNAVQTLRPELDAVKGGDVLSDAKVEAMVRRAARYYNEDPSAVIGQIVKAGQDAVGMVRNMEAGYLVSNKMFLDAYDVVNKVRWGNLDDFGGDRAVAIAEAKRRLELAVQTFGSAQSIRSNVGRSMRRLRSDFQISPQDLSKLKSLDDDKFVELMSTTGGDPKKMRDLAKPGVLKRVLDEAMFSMRNGLLWLYPTHLINLTGNVYMQVARPLEKTVGATLLGTKGKPIREQAAKEFYYTASSITDGWKAGVEAFMKGDSKLAPHMTDWLDSNGSAATAHQPLSMPTFRSVNDFADLWHNLHLASLYRNATGLPTRALGGQDEFFKTLRYRAVVQSRAAITGESMGLSGRPLRDFIEDRLAKAFDGEGKGIDREALYEAQTSTFNQELLSGTLGASIRNVRSQHPALGLVLPFVKTPINVLRYAHKYTPVLNLAQKEYRLMAFGKNGVEQQAQAIGQMALGSFFMGSALLLANSGRITGGGPADGQLRQQLLSTGWKPYSVKVLNDDGSVTYVPYGRLDPPGMVMGIVADLHHLYTVDPESRDYGDLAAATTIAMAKNFSEKTFLLNMNQLIDALSDPENKMEKFLGNTGAAMVPASSALRGYINQDPYLRDARDLIDRILKDVPGFSETLPPRRDVFGDPVVRRVGLSANSKLGLVDEEHNRIMLETGNGLSMPSPVHNGVDLRDLSLSDGRNAYDVYQEFAGNPGETSLRDALEQLIQSEGYRDLGDGDGGTAGTRLNAMMGVVQKYRAAGYKKLLSDYPEIGKLLVQKRAEAAATYLNNRTGGTAGEKLLKDLGY